MHTSVKTIDAFEWNNRYISGGKYEKSAKSATEGNQSDRVLM